jgi:hypothetical protein
MEVVLEVRADDRCGPLGAQDNVMPTAVFEPEHFLLNDVRRFSDGSEEDRSVFNDRGAEFLIPVEAGQSANRVFNVGPPPHRINQEIGCPTEGLERH